MDKYWCSFRMGRVQTMVCVKRVKQEEPEDWDESMPLPGDIIEGFAEDDIDMNEFMPVKARTEFCSQLGKISSQQVEAVWVKVRRGDTVIKLRASIVSEKSSMLHRKFTIRALNDDRHIVVLGDLDLDQCSELQEMSREVVNLDGGGFNKTGVIYDWKMKMGKFLPKNRSSVVASILFKPMADEHNVEIETTTSRSMAWFSAAVSSGIPLVFVNIQTEQIMNSGKSTSSIGKEANQSKQQNQTTFPRTIQGIRLWFLPGVAEELIELFPEHGETRFGMDIKRTDEGFICVYSVTKGLAADRAGLGRLQKEANETGHQLVISRLEGKSLMPVDVCSSGLIHCCDHTEIREAIASAIGRMEGIEVTIMAWPNLTRPSTPRVLSATTLQPPSEY